jgi:Caspase domain
MLLDHSHTKAILIGNSEYPHWPKGNIQNIVINLEKLKAVLCNSDLVGIKDHPDNYIELLNYNKVDILVKVNDLIDKCNFEDTLILYYAGHGLLDISDMKKLYLATGDTRDNATKFTCISSDELKEPLMKCKAGNKIMILDCCFAAKAAGLQSDAASLGISYWGNTEGVYFLMSSDVDTPSRFDPNDSTIPTFFTQKLVQTISEGSDSEREIWTLDELFGVMKQKWDKKIAPEPINLTFKGIGGMPFCYNHFVSAKLKNTGKGNDLRRWDEIKLNPTDENIKEFIDNCKDPQLREEALSLWDKVTNDWELLSNALAEGTFAALRKFISENNPVKSVLEIATEKMKVISAESRSRLLNQPSERTRTGSMEKIRSTAAGSINPDKNLPGIN